MTKTFARFLRSLADDDLIAFAQERRRVRPPYWQVMRLALQVESDRRQLSFEEDTAESIGTTTADSEARAGTASPTERAPGW